MGGRNISKKRMRKYSKGKVHIGWGGKEKS